MAPMGKRLQRVSSPVVQRTVHHRPRKALQPLHQRSSLRPLKLLMNTCWHSSSNGGRTSISMASGTNSVEASLHGTLDLSCTQLHQRRQGLRSHMIQHSPLWGPMQLLQQRLCAGGHQRLQHASCESMPQSGRQGHPQRALPPSRSKLSRQQQQ